MGALITFIITRTGLGSLAASIAAYAVIALIAGGSLWGYGLYKYEHGKSVGVSQERIAWEETRKRELAKQAAQKAADQARIDQIEQDNLALERRASDADAALERVLSEANPTPVMPKIIGHALNGVGR